MRVYRFMGVDEAMRLCEVLQHPKVAYVIDKKDLVNPNGLFSIKDYLEKQEI